jgi:signal transduction histidine kinase
MRFVEVVAPLASRATFRRGVFLLLGGIALLPYVALTVGFVQIFAEPDVPYAPMIVLVAVTAVVGAIPPFLAAIRSLEITASRNLLDVDLPEPATDPPWEARLLGAAWYVLHLLCGGLVLFAILYAAPTAVLLTARAAGADGAWRDAVSMAPFEAAEGVWVVLVAIALVLALGYLVAAIGALLGKVAPLLLGPTPAELQSALDAQAAEFAERNRLARDLHDSVGHALTITTLQAAAARRVLDSDPEFARRAMEAVEEAGRSAMEDLDYVLGVLRVQADDDVLRPRTLGDLDQLIDDLRAAGSDIATTSTGDLSAVPSPVSREAFRVIQEGLTNAIRHAGQVPVTLRIDTDPTGLAIDIQNPLPAGQSEPRPGGGRGLRGMRERVLLLGGEVSVGPHEEAWRVRVRLPIRSAGDRRRWAR